MKNALCLRLLFCCLLLSPYLSARVIVTQAATNLTVCQSTITSGSFSPLPTLILTESNNNDFTSSDTLRIRLPRGWRFNPAAGNLSASTVQNVSFLRQTDTSIVLSIGSAANGTIENIQVAGMEVVPNAVPVDRDTLTIDVASDNALIPTVNNLGMLNTVPPATVSITIDNNPTCLGANVTFTANASNATSPTFQWTVNGSPITGATNSTFTTNTLSNGNTVAVVMTVSGSSCFTTNPTTSNTISVTVNTPIPPTMSATENSGVTPNDNRICAGASVTLTQTGLTNPSWNVGGTTNSITVSPSSSTTFIVTGTDVSGCTSTGTIAITVDAAPSVSITANDASGTAINDNRICANDNVTVQANPFVPTSTYSWNPNIGNIAGPITFSPSVTNTYTVTVTNTNQCSNTATITIEVTPLPNNPIAVTETSGIVNNDGAVCLNDTFNLTASGGATYNWTPSINFANATVNGPGPHPAVGRSIGTSTFTVTITDANNCTNSVSTSVNVFGLPAVAVTEQDVSGNASNDGIICTGDGVSLSATASPQYLWQPGGATTQSIQVNPTSTTNFTVTVTNVNGCTASATNNIVVNALPQPIISISPNSRVICQNSPSVQLDAGSFSSYNWTTTGETTQTITFNPTNAGDQTFSVNVTDVNGCLGTDTFALHVTRQPTLIPATDIEVCHNSTVNGIAFLVNNAENVQVSWSMNNSSLGLGTSGTGNIPSFSATNNGTAEQSGTIVATPTNFFSGQACPGASDSMVLTVDPQPSLLSATNVSICSGDSLNYTILSTVTANMSFGWIPTFDASFVSGPQTQSPVANNVILDQISSNTPTQFQNVTYALSLIYNSASGTNQCILNVPLQVRVNPLPPDPVVTNLATGSILTSLCAGDEFESYNVTNDPGNGVTYNWTATSAPPGLVGLSQEQSTNSLVSFFATQGQAYTATISVTTIASPLNGSCSNQPTTFNIVVNDNNQAADSLVEQRIVIKEPGTLLVYLDNTVDTYQWGADDKQTLVPQIFPGEVFQTYLHNGIAVPDTANQFIWVLVEKGGCRSKVYFNGPNSRRMKNPEAYTAGVSTRVYPNPSTGAVTYQVEGEIWDELNWSIVDRMGKTVMSGILNKDLGRQSVPLDLRELSSGIYIIRLESNLGQHISRFTIQH